MLGHRAIGTEPLLSVQPGESPPYLIDLDDETEIDRVHLVIITPYLPPSE